MITVKNIYGIVGVSHFDEIWTDKELKMVFIWFTKRKVINTYIAGCRGASQLGGPLLGIPPGYKANKLKESLSYPLGIIRTLVWRYENTLFEKDLCICSRLPQNMAHHLSRYSCISAVLIIWSSVK